MVVSTRPLWLLFLVIGVFIRPLGATPTAAADETIVEDAHGADVVNQVVRLIVYRSQIFKDDKNFLRRIAYVETKFGSAAWAYPPDYHGGIWRLDEDKYAETKDASLAQYHREIEDYFSIDWSSTTWRDLRKPLYSGLANRLYLASKFPQDVIVPFLPEQALWWATEYNVNPDWDANYFSREIEDLESDPTCDGLLDLVIVMDGSGSIGGQNFELARQFSANLVATFSLTSTRVGFVIYSSSVRTVFELDNGMSPEEMNRTILGVAYPGGGTNTGDGIVRGIQLFANAQPRPGVPKLLAVFTDGQSNGGIPVVQAAAQALAANLTSFGIGIGSGIHQPELLIIANGRSDHVFVMTTGYEELAEFFKRFNEQVCDEPQEPGFEEVVEDTLKENERRYFKFDLPPQGVGVRIASVAGATRAYYSYTEQNPSSAFHDGVLTREETFIPARPSSSRQKVNGDSLYIAVQGVEPVNDYALEAAQGNCAMIRNPEQCFDSPLNCSFCLDDCFQEGVPRCGDKAGLLQSGCGLVSEENPCTATNRGQNIAMTTVAVENTRRDCDSAPVLLCPAQRVNVTLTFDLEPHPLDLYYLMDFSGSMRDDQLSVIRLSGQLIDTLANLTRDFTLGFGTFVDKPVRPFGDPIGDYSFRNNLPLTANSSEFVAKISEAVVKDGRDAPEGQGDALAQIGSCGPNIGWRNNSRRVLVLASDAVPHDAGDGAAGGILDPYVEGCFLDRSGYYIHDASRDYPSLSAVGAGLEAERITTIFAVTEDVFLFYEVLSAQIHGSVLGTLQNDSSNIVQLLEEEYTKLESVFELENSASGTPGPVQFRYFSTCGQGDGAPELETGKCEGVQAGSGGPGQITFRAQIEMPACPRPTSSGGGAGPDAAGFTARFSRVGLPKFIETKFKYVCAVDWD